MNCPFCDGTAQKPNVSLVVCDECEGTGEAKRGAIERFQKIYGERADEVQASIGALVRNLNEKGVTLKLCVCDEPEFNPTGMCNACGGLLHDPEDMPPIDENDLPEG